MFEVRILTRTNAKLEHCTYASTAVIENTELDASLVIKKKRDQDAGRW
jgi:hypothetical protein